MYVSLAATMLGGCVSLRPVAPVVDAPGGVRVLVRGQDDDLFRLEVVNYGRAPITVDGGRVVIVTASGTRARIAGGSDAVDRLPPGAHHTLDVRFALGAIRPGDRVAISLAGAVTLNGQLLTVPALEFVAD
jgi:hypothetical protein